MAYSSLEQTLAPIQVPFKFKILIFGKNKKGTNVQDKHVWRIKHEQ